MQDGFSDPVFFLDSQEFFSRRVHEHDLALFIDHDHAFRHRVDDFFGLFLFFAHFLERHVEHLVLLADDLDLFFDQLDRLVLFLDHLFIALLDLHRFFDGFLLDLRGDVVRDLFGEDRDLLTRQGKVLLDVLFKVLGDGAGSGRC